MSTKNIQKNNKVVKKYTYIGNRKIGEGQLVFIIAEAGVNHNGNINLAKKLIDAAKVAGADAVKFQTFRAEELVTRFEKSQFEMLKRLELREGQFEELKDYCEKRRIIFLSTPFDAKSARFLYRLGIAAFKVSSGDLTNTPLLTQIASYRKPIILSTGMSDLSEVKEAVDAVCSTGNKNLILLHCTSNYPAKYEDVNLKAMDALRKNFEVPVGYSDHTKGIEVSVAAVARGACIIEKHLTLDKNLSGPDHRASLNPYELKSLVVSVRNIEKAIGNGVKSLRKSEKAIKKIARRSIVAVRDIKKGSKLTLDVIGVKRPAGGMEPKYIGKIIGRRVKGDIKKDMALTWDVLV